MLKIYTAINSEISPFGRNDKLIRCSLKLAINNITNQTSIKKCNNHNLLKNHNSTMITLIPVHKFLNTFF